MQRYIADPDVHINHHDPVNSMSVDSGDIELGRAKPSSLSSLPMGVPSGTSTHSHTGAITGMALARPNQIQRGNSKSGIINCVTTGKEVIRTQSAFVRAGHSQEPGGKHERRTSLLLMAKSTGNPTNGSTMTQKKHRKRSDSSLNSSHQYPHNELLTTHSSKHGMYMVSSRNVASVDSRSMRANDSERLASVEQYCLQKVAPQTRASCILTWLGCGGGTVLSIYDTSQTQSKPCVCFGFEFNLVVVNFFHWLFRQTFTTVIITLSACFIALALIFAVGIYIYGIRNPECIVGANFAETKYFTDAFQLSWTTLSTSGYGAIQPVIPSRIGDCLPITITMALEGFFGVLSASLFCAVFFAKVSRLQSFAQVDFSEVACIRYGYGLNDDTPIGNKAVVATTFPEDLEDESSSAINVEMDTKLPCPVLEFRLVNRMHNIPGGEIVDARINVVASIDSANLNSNTSTPMNGLDRNSAKAIKRRPGKKRRVSRRTDHPSVYSLSERVASMRTMTLPQLDESFGALDETQQQSSIPRTILTKLDCESLDHPFFKRVFTIRHRLDEYSPLLKVGPKLMIQANDGYWPHELNDAKSVRESIHFDEIIIRLTGLSNADANTVFSHTVYDFNDLRVGYQFSHMLYRSVGDGSLRANTSLLSSVIEQEGGGGEVLKSEVNVRKIRDVSMRL